MSGSAPNVSDLPLADAHPPPTVAWWPPAPGWWVLTGILLLLIAAVLWWRRRRARLRRDAQRRFDDTLAGIAEPTARVAAISELLRRAARRRDPGADRLQGDAWLRFLDADASGPRFDAAAGRLLLEGGFRREVSSRDLPALEAAARARFVDWMVRRPVRGASR